MTDFAHAVNFTISFGVTVLPEDINKLREALEKSDTDDILWDISVNKDSSDEQLAKFIGLENYRDHLISEPINMEMEEHHVYNKKDTERLQKEYYERLKEFKRMNKQNTTKVSK